MSQSEKQNTGVSTDFVQALEGLGALGVTYNLAAHAFNSVASAFSGGTAVMSLPVFFNIGIRWGSILGELILVCLASGFLAWVVLNWVCKSFWVQEKVNIKKCWTEIKWYNPWSWVKAVVCTVKEVLKWVLKTICGWKEVIVATLTIACLIAAVVVAL